MKHHSNIITETSKQYVIKHSVFLLEVSTTLRLIKWKELKPWHQGKVA